MIATAWFAAFLFCLFLSFSAESHMRWGESSSAPKASVLEQRAFAIPCALITGFGGALEIFKMASPPTLMGCVAHNYEPKNVLMMCGLPLIFSAGLYHYRIRKQGAVYGPVGIALMIASVGAFALNLFTIGSVARMCSR